MKRQTTGKSILNRILLAGAIIGLIVTMTGTAMAATGVNVGVVIRVFGMFILLASGVAFVARSIVSKQRSKIMDNRGQNTNAGIQTNQCPSNSVYVRIVVLASRAFGVFVVILAVISLGIALFNIATSGYQIGRYGSWNFIFQWIQMLLLPFAFGGAGLILLCLAEILDRVARLTLVTLADHQRRETFAPESNQ